MKTALITGASSGIGYELAFIHAAEKNNLVLVARNEQKLLEMKTKLEQDFGISVTVLAFDLSLAESPERIFTYTQEHGIFVDYLVNNAGFGDFGFFQELDWNRTNEMIQLNITALTHLTHLYLKEMVKANSGKILNVASTAAFQPGPLMAVYFATKAFVLNFSEAIENELKSTAITVTVLCPGPTATNFLKVASIENNSIVKDKKIPSAKEVAMLGHKSMMKGKSVVIHGAMNAFLVFATRLVPRKIVTRISRRIMGA